MEVVDVVEFGNGGVFVGVEEREEGSRVCDHGPGTLKVVHAESEDFGVVVSDAVVVSLQLDELRSADASEESPVEDEDDVFVAFELGEGDFACTVGDG